jgi:hypothetical protein
MTIIVPANTPTGTILLLTALGYRLIYDLDAITVPDE